MTREEISMAWQNAQCIGNHEGGIAERTFFRYIRDIKDLFDIEIKCNRRDRTYYIANREDKWYTSRLSWCRAHSIHVIKN